MKGILMDSNNKEQIEFVRNFLSDFRNENFNAYKGESCLRHQACSNVIGLLAKHLKSLEVEE